MSGATTWVFGYGSLVSPDSLSSTLQRDVTVGVDVVEADLFGWGRRWNYGVGGVAVSWDVDGRRVERGTIVALGLVASPDERVNGIIARVDPDELARLDRRERDYDRVDVSGSVTLRGPSSGSAHRDAAGHSASAVAHRIVTYVPRPSAVDRYRSARDAGTAGVRKSYWDLVDGAFGALGTEQHDLFHRSTPPPDVPLVDPVAASPRADVR